MDLHNNPSFDGNIARKLDTRPVSALLYTEQRVTRGFIDRITRSGVLCSAHQNGLFAYAALLSRAVPHTLKGVGGNCIIGIYSLRNVFDVRNTRSVLKILDSLQDKGLINYFLDNHKQTAVINLLAMNVSGGEIRHGAIAHACEHRKGFFFMQKDVAEYFRGTKWSDKDIALDIWLNTIYNDDFYPLSVVPMYVLRGTVQSHHTIRGLAQHYNCSAGRMQRLLQKLQIAGLITAYSYRRFGTYIFSGIFAKQLFKKRIDMPTPAQFLSTLMESFGNKPVQFSTKDEYECGEKAQFSAATSTYLRR